MFQDGAPYSCCRDIWPKLVPYVKPHFRSAVLRRRCAFCPLLRVWYYFARVLAPCLPETTCEKTFLGGFLFGSSAENTRDADSSHHGFNMQCHTQFTKSFHFTPRASLRLGTKAHRWTRVQCLAMPRTLGTSDMDHRDLG